MPLDFKFDIYGLNRWHFINFNCHFTECESSLSECGSGMTSLRYSSSISIGLNELVLFFSKIVM